MGQLAALHARISAVVPPCLWHLTRHCHTSSALPQSGAEARSTGNHCGGQAWSISASLLASLDLIMCGTEVAQKAAATPMRTSARKKEGSSFTASAINLFLVVCLESAHPATGCLAAVLAAILAAILTAILVVTQSGTSFICAWSQA